MDIEKIVFFILGYAFCMILHFYPVPTELPVFIYISLVVILAALALMKTNKMVNE